MDFALLYDGSAYSMKGKVMGRQSAGAAFLKSIADTRPEKLWCYTGSRAAALDCARNLSELGSPRTGVAWIPADEPKRLAEPGLLFRPDPGIGQHAWHRLAQAEARAYSLCGLTHTISSHGPMSAFAEYLTAPVEAWDAVICTSRAARDAIRYVLEQQAEHLRQRLGATRFTLPQLPVIPLGIHTRQFAATGSARAAARARFGLAEEEVAFLFAGRLIAHGKAHPLPMYLALEQAAQGRQVALIQAGQASSPEVLKIFTEEPKRFCPSVRNIMVDGRDFELYRAAWSAADIFTSLSDNIQETFGLTPLEAMSAGLPVVVSDWDGYKDTVRDGVDGFRTPTLTLPAGSGYSIASRLDMGLIDFDHYSGYISQLVAVDIEATAQAYRRLIDDRDLRHRMGEAGAIRAREQYDWAVIYRRYQSLWEELTERRRADPQINSILPRRQRPDRADPFSMFSTYPTSQISATTRFRRRAGVDFAEAVSRGELASTSFAKAVHPDQNLTRSILSLIETEWVTHDYVTGSFHEFNRANISAALVWLSKIGALDFK